MTAIPRTAALVVTDLDGTLLDASHRIAAVDRATLEALGRRGVCRVAATGRSLYSLRRVLVPADPFDYVIFSSGVGIMDWPTQALIRSTALSPVQVRQAVQALVAEKASFMLHDPLPDNHHFAFHEGRGEDTDFRRRCELYRGVARRLDPAENGGATASQLVVIMPADLPRFARLAARLNGLSVVRTTSPLDGRSLWLEAFAPGTNKSGATAWLADRLGLALEQTCALGNDFNDLDLLTWARQACVTANAPAELARRFPVVRAHDDGGFSHAIERWGLLG